MNSEWEEPRFNPKQFEECQAKVAKYEALIQNHDASINARKEAVQRDAETSKRKRADAQRVLREEIAKLEQCIREHQEKLPETQERTRQLAEQVDASRTQYHEALTQKKSIQKTRDHLAASIERKKAEKQSRTTEAGRHLDRSQLDATRNAAKLTISGQGDFKNKFTFTCINESNPDQKYYFVLRYGSDRVYSVTNCKPPVENLDELLAQLQQDNDPLSFIKSMRSAFCKHAATHGSAPINR